jgi:hypothetical protein
MTQTDHDASTPSVMIADTIIPTSTPTQKLSDTRCHMLTATTAAVAASRGA